jgi:hypothetical protein
MIWQEDFVEDLRVRSRRRLLSSELEWLWLVVCEKDLLVLLELLEVLYGDLAANEESSLRNSEVA